MTLSAEQCRHVLAVGSRSFSWAAVFLPPDRRDDAAVLYALCRTIDDLADEAPDAEHGREALDLLTAELIGEATPRPLVQLFDDVTRRRGLSKQPVLHLIEGVRSDLGPVQMEDDRDLLRYCYRVAGTVGLLMAGLLGVSDERASPSPSTSASPCS
ncbi:MAG: squalene/phytoene synthase family protein [Myxococcales bacterium]|nr:squalene/phytoene synthase family protein [Myxococcales bacterium]